MPDSEDEELAQTTLQPEFEEEASTTIEKEKAAKQLGVAVKPLPVTKESPALKPIPVPTIKRSPVTKQAPALKPPITGMMHTGTGTGTNLDDHTVDDRQMRDVLSAITPLRQENAARLIITQGNDAGLEIEIRPGKAYTIGRAIDNDCVLTDISVSRKHFDVKFEDGAWVIVDRGSGNGTVVNGNLEDNPFVLAHSDVIEIGNTMFRFDQPNGIQRASVETFESSDEEMSTVAGKQLRDAELQRDEAQVLTRPRPKTMPPAVPTPIRPHSPSGPPPLAYPTPMHGGLAASTLPMPQMANRQPLVGPGAPTMLGDAMGMPRNVMPPNQLPLSPLTPTGIPMSHNGFTLQGAAPASRPSFPYPQANEIPPHSVHAQMLQIQAANRRGDLSTAHVSPVPYNSMNMPAARYSEPPQISRRTKLVLAGIGLAVLTGIVTAAVIKSSGNKPKPVASGGTPATKASAKNATDPKKDTPKTPPAIPTVAPQGALGEPPKQEPPKAGSAAIPTIPDAVAITPKQEPVKDVVTPVVIDKSENKTEPKVEAKVEPKRDTKVEPKRDTKRESRRDTEPRRETPKRVSAADADSAFEKADGLYRDKKFNAASSLLAAAAKTADPDEAKQLRYKSELYAKLAKAYALGTAPAQNANVAYENLTSALTYDKNLGGEFAGDLESKQSAVAARAAVSYAARAKDPTDWAKARNAYLFAMKSGSNDANLPLVKQKLEAAAGELYKEAEKEIGTSPGPAKDKLKQVKALVDSKSTWYAKADALLKKG